MLTKRQYVILNACFEDWEVFYFPFAEVNYGGQVCRRAASPDCLQYEDEREWPIGTPAEVIAADIAALGKTGLLEVRTVTPDGDTGPAGLPTGADLSPYAGYDCLTFEDHVERFGIGPHVFRISEPGRAEIDRPEYRGYDEELGWVE